ncbi:hypothetical protein COMA2_20015 [Candidatus Nitrospira nitrificans]|uniref:Uncharacterized protein n=1 Tax=Candidatus Nitrospira nitrificans TaxID=1742973 RepID=A0A0S4LBC9_9BACT|nr:hypothetical protein COMA2_20015 [Candidatus Nitrospira nitrificans]
MLRRSLCVKRISSVFLMLHEILPQRVGLGDPAAHKTDCLPLLPSGSGGVHRVLLHRAQPLFSIETLQPKLQVSIRPQKSRYSEKKQAVHTKCGMAERVGFEPTVPLPGRMLSKHVDSSTLAPLRIEKCKGTAS